MTIFRAFCSDTVAALRGIASAGARRRNALRGLCAAIMVVASVAPGWAGAGHGSANGYGSNGQGSSGALCQGYGPQTPRDISQHAGASRRVFALAPPARDMNLCNIHMHSNAEHRGPGFSVPAAADTDGGFLCNNSHTLTRAERAPVKKRPGRNRGMMGVNPGDTIEVHWVFSSCDVAPGPAPGSCLSPRCANPELRVESQVFLVVNDPNALDFEYFAYGGNRVNGFHQPKEIPGGTGAPVVFAGSSAGTEYSASSCSPYQVTWSVRPNCAKVDIQSVHDWADSGNVFHEYRSHGVRPLVTAPELLSPINSAEMQGRVGH
ncbi:delta-class carbonic anhydrase [Litorivita pollutaquae]|uniref:delta-class carbonic anhydrase n=1 Tax=Litorivita pollutaquae TaxID=2200892 RepID=UPI001EEF6AF4|nr:delta-class carbonic anhydrase [Litorivita pollutaquae]